MNICSNCGQTVNDVNTYWSLINHNGYQQSNDKPFCNKRCYNNSKKGIKEDNIGKYLEVNKIE